MYRLLPHASRWPYSRINLPMTEDRHWRIHRWALYGHAYTCSSASSLEDPVQWAEAQIKGRCGQVGRSFMPSKFNVDIILSPQSVNRCYACHVSQLLQAMAMTAEKLTRSLQSFSSSVPVISADRHENKPLAQRVHRSQSTVIQTVLYFWRNE